ncbi:hypothetical protein BH10PSE14_BH10PSE14_06800 [soil metagenome]
MLPAPHCFIGVTMRAAILLLSLLGGCTPAHYASNDALRELEIVERANGSAQDLCDAHKKVLAALLTEHNEKQYRFEKGIADQQCLNARMGL